MSGVDSVVEAIFDAVENVEGVTSLADPLRGLWADGRWNPEEIDKVLAEEIPPP